MSLALQSPPALPAERAFRVMPQNLEAEQALLGAIMINNSTYERVADILRDEHFFEPVHQRIFSAVAKMAREGRTANPITLKPYFDNDPALADVGPGRYLAQLAASVVTIINSADYARLIIDMWQRRQLIEIATNMANKAYEQDIEFDAAAQLGEAQRQLDELDEKRTGATTMQPLSAFVRESMLLVEKSYKSGGVIQGTSTGLKTLDHLTTGLHPSDLVILAGRPSMGKAQPLDAKILMLDGSWKRMGETKFGDRVASIDGAPSFISGVFPQGERQVFRVTLSDGRSTRCCGEHLWQVNSSRWIGGPRTLDTNELARLLSAKRYYRRITLPLFEGHAGSTEPMPMDPWLLGVLIANGHLTDNHIKVSTADAATLFRIQKVVGQHLVVQAGDYEYRINQGDQPAADTVRAAIRSLGLAGAHSLNKFIPPQYLTATKAVRLELLRGLLDTDGWVEKFGAVRIAVSSERLAGDIQALVRSLGGLCSIAIKHPTFTHKGEKREGAPSFVLNIQHEDRGSLMTLKRKQRRCDGGHRFRPPTIVSIVPDGVEAVQCIKVTHPSSLYVTDDYIVTHNTTLATNIAFNVARAFECHQDERTKEWLTDAGGVVAFFSLEMRSVQLVTRILSTEADVAGDRIRKGQITKAEFDRYEDAGMRLTGMPFHIEDRPGLTVPQIRAACRSLKRRGGLDLVIIDYLQLIRSPGKKSGREENRVQELSEITKSLKELAKELNVPVIALSQLSRALETREDKRPQLADLRESGSIEQDADVVLFVYREEYYLGRAEPAQRPEEGDAKFSERVTLWEQRMNSARGVGEVIAGKQRHGPIGNCRLAFTGSGPSFYDLAYAGETDHG